MAYINITDLPTEPKRSDTTDVFVANADAWVDALAVFVDETNAGGGEINSISAQVTSDLASTNADAVSTGEDRTGTNSDVNYAKEWAEANEDFPVSVAAGGDGATTFSSGHHAIKSEASHQSALTAAAAAGAGAGLPTLTGNAGKALSVNATADGVEWADIDTKSIEINITVNSFNIAVNGGLSVQNMVDGVSDAFNNEEGVEYDKSIGVIFGSGSFDNMPDDQGFDISSNVAYSTESHSFPAPVLSVTDMKFNNDGTKLFVLYSNKLYEYTVATAFDLSSAVTHTSQLFDFSNEDLNAGGFAFNNNGTKLFTCGSSGDYCYQYSLSTGFDLSSTVTYTTKSLSTIKETGYAPSMVFNGTGAKLFLIGYDSNPRVYEYSLSTDFDLSSAVYSGHSASIQSVDSQPAGLAFSNDGTKMYTSGNSSRRVYEHTVGIGFDLSSAVTYTGNSFHYLAQTGSNSNGVVFNNEGTKFFVGSSTNDAIYEYDCPNISRTGSTELTLHTKAFTALASPSSAFVVVQEEDVDAIALNTDFTAWISRAGSTTYTTVAASDDKLRATSHGFSNDDRVILATATGVAFPVGLGGQIAYYVINATTNNFEVSLTSGGAAVAITADNAATQRVAVYNQVILEEDLDLVSSGRILSGTADLTSQAAGTDIKTVLMSHNAKNMKLHSLSTQWK